MRIDQNRYIRQQRGHFAAASQALYSHIEPYLMANAKGKRWSFSDRTDLDDALEEFHIYCAKIWRALSSLFDQHELARGERERFNRLVRAGKLRCFKKGSYGAKEMDFFMTLAPPGAKPSEVPGAFQCLLRQLERMDSVVLDQYEAKYEPVWLEMARRRGAKMKIKPSQVRFVELWPQLEEFIRRIFGALFFLTEDGIVKVFKVTKKDLALYLDSVTREDIKAKYRRMAREYAEKHKTFVEVIFRYPSSAEDEWSLMYDAGPLDSRIRVMEVSPEDTAVLFARSASERDEMLDVLEAAAEEMALETGATIEVEIVNPSTGEKKVIYEVAPDQALVLSRELTLERRRQTRAWPFVANPSDSNTEMDLLLAMYARRP
jgi:hypothetical protein